MVSVVAQFLEAAASSNLLPYVDSKRIEDMNSFTCIDVVLVDEFFNQNQSPEKCLLCGDFLYLIWNNLLVAKKSMVYHLYQDLICAWISLSFYQKYQLFYCQI